MPSIERLIELKTERLESIPDELLSRLERVQKKVLPQVLELLMLLDTNADGFIELTDKNIQLLATIQSQLRDVLLNSEYVEAVDEFVDQFEVQAGVSDELFKAVFTDFVTAGKASQLIQLSKRSATDLFINGITDEAFVDAIYKQLDLAISNNASFSETVRTIQQIVTGDSEVDGKILQYSKQVAHDAFALSDRNYTSAVSEEIGAEWFLYSGNVISTSRDFCRERHNHYYYYIEIESWADEDWDGKIEGTNSRTIYATAGGWNCRHTMIPVSLAIVPIKVIEDAMKNGWFVPTDFEVQELGL